MCTPLISFYAKIFKKTAWQKLTLAHPEVLEV